MNLFHEHIKNVQITTTTTATATTTTYGSNVYREREHYNVERIDQ